MNVSKPVISCLSITIKGLRSNLGRAIGRYKGRDAPRPRGAPQAAQAGTLQPGGGGCRGRSRGALPVQTPQQEPPRQGHHHLNQPLINQNSLLMIRESLTVSIPCCTKPLSKVALPTQIS